MISRRGLLSGILTAGVAPWIVKAGVLMLTRLAVTAFVAFSFSLTLFAEP